MFSISRAASGETPLWSFNSPSSTTPSLGLGLNSNILAGPRFGGSGFSAGCCSSGRSPPSRGTSRHPVPSFITIDYTSPQEHRIPKREQPEALLYRLRSEERRGGEEGRDR